MKEICFLLSADKNMYSFLFNQLRDGDNVDRDKCPVIMASALDLFIHK